MGLVAGRCWVKGSRVGWGGFCDAGYPMAAGLCDQTCCWETNSPVLVTAAMYADTPRTH